MRRPLQRQVTFIFLICLMSIPLVGLTACTREEQKLPDEKAYSEQGMLLVNTSQKISDEPDVHKLHEIAKALQQTRTLSCADFNNECSLFGSFLTLSIDLSSKGNMSFAERERLRKLTTEIRVAVETGKLKLRELQKSKTK
jgi:hypothetical protein